DHELRAPLGHHRHVPGIALPLADPHLLVCAAVGGADRGGRGAADAGDHRHPAVHPGRVRAEHLDCLPRGARLAGAARPAPAVHMRPGVLVAAATTLLLAGCGQKGPLYLPDKKPAVVSAPAAPATAADPAATPKKKTDDDTDQAATPK